MKTGIFTFLGLKTAIGFFIVFLQLSAHAQMSGTYSIGTSGDYATFDAAITDLVTQGINGDVTFRIEAGSYYEQLIIDGSSIAKSDSDLSIFFIGNGDREDVILYYSENTENKDYTLSIDGIENLFFEGITFQNSSPDDYGSVVTVGNAEVVTNISFDDCYFQGQSRLDYNSFPTLLFFNGGGAHEISVTNSRFEAAYYGLTSFGTSDAVIENNEFINQSIQSLSLSIDHALVRGNYVENDESAVGYSIGIEMWSSSDFIVDRNTILLNNGAKGMQIQSSSLADSTINLVSNNYLELNNTTNSVVGVNFDLASELDFVHNTVKMSSLLSVLSFTGGSNVGIYNNILMNYGDGSVYSAILNVFHDADYNFAYTAGDVFSTLGSTLEEHKINSSLDSNSNGFYLEFPVTNSPIICHYILDDAGKELEYTSLTDYFENSRDTSSPDIGAYEFVLPDVTIFNTDTLAICLGDTITLSSEDAFEAYLWMDDSTTTSIRKVYEDEALVLQVEHSGGCTLIDSIQVETQSVALDLGEDLVLCMGQSLVLKIDDEYESYLWSTGEETTAIEVSEAGSYALDIANEIGCTASDTLVVEFAEVELVPNFLVSGIGCTSDTLQFLEVSNIEPDSVEWDFGDDEISLESHPIHYYSSVGEYTVNLTASLDGCTLDVEKDIVITSTCADYLIAYYPLDTAANDIGDNGYDGTLSGDVVFVDDNDRGLVAYLDGDDDFIELTTSGALDMVNSSFTVSAWIKGIDFDGENPILGTSVEQDNQGLNLGLIDGKGNLGFYNNSLTGTQILNPGEWHYFTFTYDVELGEMSIYIDGELDSQETEKKAFSGLDLVSIGSAQSDAYFNGYIDDVMIWQEVLTADEIFENWSGYSTVLLAHYELSSDANDLSGNDFHGSTNGSILFSEDDVRGSVASFGGTSTDYILLPSADDIGITKSSFYISAWVKVDAFDQADQAILGTNSNAGNRNDLQLVVNSDQNPIMGFGSVKTEDSNTTLNANTWYHVSFIYDRNEKNQIIYVNGQKTATGLRKRSFIGTDEILIGNAQDFSMGFNGYINDLKIRKIIDDEDSRIITDEITEVEENRSVLYPNPTHNSTNLTINWNEEYGGTISLLDLSGNLIDKINISGSGKIQMALPWTQLETGIYFVSTSLNNQVFVNRLIIR